MQPRIPRRSRSVRPHTFESLETRVMLAADWQNPIDPLDVDGSHDVISPLDALLVINELKSPSISEPVTGNLPDIGDRPPPFLDVDGNGRVSPLDALLVINGLPPSTSAGDVGDTDFQPGNSVIVGMPAADGDGIAHDTLVNDFTRSLQSQPSLAANSSGHSIFVWSSLTQDGSGWGIFGQRYDNNGAQIGPEFQINQHTRGTQWQPAVAMWEDGAFVTTWASAGQDKGWDVFARMYSADGTAMGDEFRVNSHNRGTQFRPAVAVSDDDGGGPASMAYVAWAGKGPGDNNGVFWTTVEMGQRTATGDRLANSTTGGLQTNPSIAVSDGGLVGVAWQGKGSGDPYGIFMDLFDSSGTSVLGETLVNNVTRTAQKTPSIAFAPNGSASDEDVVVAWKALNGEPGAGVRARTFDVMSIPNSGGQFTAAAGSVIHVNQTTRAAQKQPAVAYLNDSTFLVTWYGNGSGDSRGIFSRQFAADGTPLSDESRINETTQAIQQRPAVAAASHGYIIAWDGNGPADRHGIFARFVDTELSGPFVVDPIPNMTIDEGDTLMVTATVTFLDGNAEPVFFSFGNAAPTGATIDTNSGLITWMTTEADGGGMFDFDVVATDMTGFSDNETFTVTVNEVNNGIQITPIPDQEVVAGDTLMIPVTVTDSDGDDFTTSATLADGSPLPSWLTYDESTLVFTAMPQDSDVGTVMVTVTATDSGGANDMDTFSLTVLPVDTGFEFNVPAQTSTVGQLFSIDLDDFITLTGTVDPGTISFVVTQANGNALPNWLSFDGTTSVLSGTPAEMDEGQLSIRAVATGSNDTGSQADNFLLFVLETNVAPTIFDQTMRVAASAANGTVLGTVVANDPNGADTLTFEMLNDISGAFAISDSGVITVADTSALVNDTSVVLSIGVTDSGSPPSSGSGNVTVYVTDAPATAGYSLGAFDAEGIEISSLMPGQQFELRMFSTDLRTGLDAGDGGVFSAFADVLYNSGLVSVVGPVVVADLYDTSQSGQVTAPGLIDEVGGVDGISQFGTAPQEVARIPMQAGTFEGMAMFATDLADDAIQHPTLVFGLGQELPPSDIQFGGLSLTISSSNGSVMLTPPSASRVLVADVESRGELAITVDVTPTSTEALFAASTTDWGAWSAVQADDQEHHSLTDALFAQLGSDLN